MKLEQRETPQNWYETLRQEEDKELGTKANKTGLSYTPPQYLFVEYRLSKMSHGFRVPAKIVNFPQKFL